MAGLEQKNPSMLECFVVVLFVVLKKNCILPYAFESPY